MAHLANTPRLRSRLRLRQPRRLPRGLGRDETSARLFIAAATELGYSTAVAEGMASQVLFRLLIQTGQPMARLTDADLDALSLAVRDRESGRDRRLHHYRHTLHATREVLFHLGVLSEPPPVPEGRRLHADTDSPDTDRLTGTPAAVLPTSWPTWTVGEPPARAPR